MSSQHLDKQIVDGQGPVVIESTLPPTSSREMLEGEGATVLVYSHDAALARVIRGVAAERYPVRIINEWNDLLNQVGTGKGRIVLLDVDALAEDVESALTEVNRCADWLVTIIAAKQQQAQDFMRFWSERKIHRLLIKPAAAGITRLLLESAFARFIELRELHENTDSMEIPYGLVAAHEAEESGRRWLWPVVGIGIAALVAGVVWFSGVLGPSADVADSAPQIAMPEPARTQPAGPPESPEPESEAARSIRPDTAEPPVPQQPAAVPPDESRPAAAAVQPPVDPFAEQLELARNAELAGAVVEPSGGSALDHYAAILREAPDHEIAGERLNVLLEELYANAQSQILSHDFDAANATLSHIERANPPGTRLQFLRQQLVQLRESEVELERARLAAATSSPVTVAEPQTTPEPAGESAELQSMLTLTRLRVDAGQLVQPAGDSAQDYLLRALDLGGDQAEAGEIAAQFSAAALGAIPQSLAEGEYEAAGAMVSALQRLGSQAPQLPQWTQQIEAGRQAAFEAANRAVHAQALLRIEEGTYMGSDDSALELLGELRERGADSRLIADVQARFADALEDAARAAMAAGRWNETDALLETFAMASLEVPAVQSLAADLDFARRQQAYLEQTAPIGELTLVDSVPAVYPRSAIASELTGWVDLHFTVDADGATRDIDVVAAEPAGAFEDAAISALSRYRFEPYVFRDRVYERRARLRMRFEFD